MGPVKNGFGADVRSKSIARRLGSLASLSPEETDLLNRVGAGPASLWAPRSFLDHPVNDHPSQRYLISGWAARVRVLADGRRQLVHVLLPGDPLSPQLQVCDRAQTVICLTMAHTVNGAAINLATLDRARFPGIAAAIELAAAHDRALLAEQAVRLGRQTAFERMANLFMELHYRCGQVGLVHADGFAFPLTQEMLGDLLGLSVVHVNRTLQLMRHRDMISLKHGRLTLLNIPALTEAAEFRPPKLDYLHQWEDRALPSVRSHGSTDVSRAPRAATARHGLRQRSLKPDSPHGEQPPQAAPVEP
jgi:CRP-like cAMP-binding protein